MEKSYIIYSGTSYEIDSLFLNLGFSYLLALGFLGYMFLIFVIRLIGEKSNWPSWKINIIVALNFIIGLISFVHFVPTYIRTQNVTNQFSAVDTVIFVIIISIMVVFVFWLMSRWNSILNKN